MATQIGNAFQLGRLLRAESRRGSSSSPEKALAGNNDEWGGDFSENIFVPRSSTNHRPRNRCPLTMTDNSCWRSRQKKEGVVFDLFGSRRNNNVGSSSSDW
jgi:hypothetical protein